MPVPYWIDSNTSYPDALSFINDNFQKIPVTPKEFGIRFTTTATFNTGSVSAGSTFSKVIEILNPSGTSASSYVNVATTTSSIVGVTPYIKVYVDNNNDPSYIYPNGGSLTSGQSAFMLGHFMMFDPTSNSKGTFVINGRNADSGAHTYYFEVKLGYIPY
jgi:hypothetical protein